MFYELDEYLATITTPENRQFLMETCTLLSKNGIMSHETDLERIIADSDNFEVGTNLIDIFMVLTEYMTGVINEMGLFLNEEMPMVALNRVLEGLNAITDYGDPETLLTIIQQDASDVDILCDILGEVTSLTWTDFIPYITGISPGLIPLIQELVEESLPPEEERVDLTVYRERFNRFKEIRPGSLAEEIIRSGTPLGSPTEALIETHSEELATDEAQPDRLVQNLLSVLIISDTPTDDLQERLGEYLEVYAKDMFIVQKSKPLVNKIFADLISND